MAASARSTLTAGHGRRAGDRGLRLDRERRLVTRATAALAGDGAYSRRVLPIDVLRNLGPGHHGDLAALGRADAIVAGLAFTATGFLKIR